MPRRRTAVPEVEGAEVVVAVAAEVVAAEVVGEEVVAADRGASRNVSRSRSRASW